MLKLIKGHFMYSPNTFWDLFRVWEISLLLKYYWRHPLIGDPLILVGEPVILVSLENLRSPMKIWGYPSKILGFSTKILGSPTKIWESLLKIWGSPTRIWGLQQDVHGGSPISTLMVIISSQNHIFNVYLKLFNCIFPIFGA